MASSSSRPGPAATKSLAQLRADLGPRWLYKLLDTHREQRKAILLDKMLEVMVTFTETSSEVTGVVAPGEGDLRARGEPRKLFSDRAEAEKWLMETAVHRPSYGVVAPITAGSSAAFSLGGGTTPADSGRGKRAVLRVLGYDRKRWLVPRSATVCDRFAVLELAGRGGGLPVSSLYNAYDGFADDVVEMVRNRELLLVRDIPPAELGTTAREGGVVTGRWGGGAPPRPPAAPTPGLLVRAAGGGSSSAAASSQRPATSFDPLADLQFPVNPLTRKKQLQHRGPTGGNLLSLDLYLDGDERYSGAYEVTPGNTHRPSNKPAYRNERKNCWLFHVDLVAAGCSSSSGSSSGSSKWTRGWVLAQTEHPQMSNDPEKCQLLMKSIDSVALPFEVPLTGWDRQKSVGTLTLLKELPLFRWVLFGAREYVGAMMVGGTSSHEQSLAPVNDEDLGRVRSLFVAVKNPKSVEELAALTGGGQTAGGIRKRPGGTDDKQKGAGRPKKKQKPEDESKIIRMNLHMGGNDDDGGSMSSGGSSAARSGAARSAVSSGIPMLPPTPGKGKGAGKGAVGKGASAKKAAATSRRAVAKR